ncbi:hypothetical protein MT325_m815R [Paramecium bursaria chlorella virus MT325]|uniref:Uncharacterized protein m815R n=1 Tax=Paramecium bursaria Chlorella virus MT325 TaxID=346932 RepID=A7IVJ5_PBCVM|nr:hypothetical protein MT325_m815R [Paramecium bursaria chlorella virus MT325]
MNRLFRGLAPVPPAGQNYGVAVPFKLLVYFFFQKCVRLIKNTRPKHLFQDKNPDLAGQIGNSIHFD